jgi:hypothetical protein
MSLPLQHTDRLIEATAPLLLRAVAQHPLLALLTSGAIEALEAMVGCERDLTPVEVSFLREVAGFLDAAEIALSGEAQL